MILVTVSFPAFPANHPLGDTDQENMDLYRAAPVKLKFIQPLMSSKSASQMHLPTPESAILSIMLNSLSAHVDSWEMEVRTMINSVDPLVLDTMLSTLIKKIQDEV
jgi:hypothetical protein